MTSMTPVSKVMTNRVFTLKPYDTFTRVQKLFKDKAIHQLPVINDDLHLLGIIRRSDYLLLCDRYTLFNEALGERSNDSYFQNLLIKDVMRNDTNCLHTNDVLNTALELFSQQPYQSLPILNESEELVGILSITDIVKNLIQRLNEQPSFGFIFN